MSAAQSTAPIAPPQARRWHMPMLLRLSLLLHAGALAALLLAPAGWPWAVALLVANHLAITLAGLLPRCAWLGPNLTRLPAAAVARREIALTIDDGPDPALTPRVLDLLQQHGVRATFFCIGENAARHPALCREIVARGHALGNHSQHHLHRFSVLGMTAQAREIDAAQRTFITLTGQAPLFFRAPAGLRNVFLEPVLARMGLQLASWSRRGYDTRTADPALVCRRLLHGLQPGAILLMHDGHCAVAADGTPVVLAVLPMLFDAAHAAGLRFVTLPDAMRG